MKDILEYGSRDSVLILIGNKSDSVNKRIVSWDRAKQFADRYKMIYIETSAKTGHGIQEIFSIGSEFVVNKISSGGFQDRFKRNIREYYD